MSERWPWLVRAAPLLLLALLGATTLPRTEPGLTFGAREDAAALELETALDALPEGGRVLVAFDPDLGTYAEIRPTVRVLLADLLGRDAALSFVSLTAEGRALAVAELARLARTGLDATAPVDLGFVPGAEAALVALARRLSGAEEAIIDLPDASTGRPDLVVVIGGNDLGPRSWVEQVVPRVEGLPLAAVAPTVLLPELQPYRGSGQLVALVATPRDGAAYRAAYASRVLEGVPEAAGPTPLGILVGTLAAIAVLAASLGGVALEGIRAARPREPS